MAFTFCFLQIAWSVTINVTKFSDSRKLSCQFVIFSLGNQIICTIWLSIKLSAENTFLLCVFSLSLFVSLPPAAYCSINDPPLNGGVVNRTKLRPGSRLQYFCNRGHRLVGSSNATCKLDSNGLFQWDTPPPFCQGKFLNQLFLSLLSDNDKGKKD